MFHKFYNIGSGTFVQTQFKSSVSPTLFLQKGASWKNVVNMKISSWKKKKQDNRDFCVLKLGAVFAQADLESLQKKSTLAPGKYTALGKVPLA